MPRKSSSRSSRSSSKSSSSVKSGTKSAGAKKEAIRKQHSKVISAVGKQLDRGDVTRAQANRLADRIEKVATSRMKHASKSK